VKLEVVHRTSYSYSSLIAETFMELRLQPVDGEGQSCQEFRLNVRPEAVIRSYTDGFRNQVHYFNRVRAHDRVVLTSRSIVETGLPAPPDPDGESWDDFLLFRSPVVDVAGVRRLARRYQAPQPDPVSIEAALDRLTTGIAETFTYQPESTDVSTSVDEVIELKAGVCQDFAHLFIAASRAMGVPARYVSGYIYTGEGELVVGASHAWAEAWIPGRGWIGYDATHPVRVDERHVRVAVGRDYRDAAPTRGVYVGSAEGQMEVRVETRPL
jgi:transglutaminase-like putative cysteine protease